jgi:predicted phage baseplate assembly protein
MSFLDRAPVVDDRTFDDIVREARSRIPRYTEEWTDTNPGDAGFALVELFAWMSEMMLYRLGRVPARNYLAFLDLIGFRPIAAVPARAAITFPVRPDHPESTLIIGSNTQVATETAGEEGPIVFETERAITALRARLDRVWTFDGYQYSPASTANDALEPFQPFGPSPAADAALLLGFDDPAAFPAVEIELAVWLPGEGEPAAAMSCTAATTAAAPVVIAWEYWDGHGWRSLSVREDGTLGFTRSGHVVLSPPPADGLRRDRLGVAVPDERYWLRARLAGGAYQVPPQLLAVRTNTAPALQAETARHEILGGSDGSPDQVFELRERPVVAGSLIVEIDEGPGPRPWTVVEDFLGSGPDDEHVALDPTDGTLRTGDGVHGRIPVANPRSPSASVVALAYRFGGGTRGNVPAGALTALRSSLPGVDANGVTNLLPAGGGRDEEPLDVASQRAQRFLKSRDRAVTAEDFEALALAGGPIVRAKALPLHHPDYPGVALPGVVSVIVVPEGEGPAPMPTAATLRQVCAHLDARRTLTSEVFVLPPRYRTVRVRAELFVRDGADLAAVQRAAEDALHAFFDARRGGPDGDGWPFGGGVYHAVVSHRLMVADVVRVADLILGLDGVEAPPCTDVDLGPHELVVSGWHELRVSYHREARA